MVHGVYLRELARKLFGENVSSKIWKRMEILGEILILRKPYDVSVEKLRLLGEHVLNELTYVRSVWCSISEVRGKHRVRDFIHLCGDYRSETVYVEHETRFLIDITKVYVSSALNYEHKRVAEKVKDGERILNMFSGVGLFSLIMAKRKDVVVYSIDINPYAYYYMVKSICLNNLKGKVIPILGDSKEVILEGKVTEVDRVLMPLPELVYDYLKYALNSLKRKGYLHVYLFVNGENRVRAKENAMAEYTSFLRKHVSKVVIEDSRVIRSVGKRRYQVVLDYYVEK